jgi:glycosyltransferase involved in cell wall biosynthesis
VWGQEYWVRYAGRLGHVGSLIERLAAHMPDQIIAVSPQTAERLRATLRLSTPISSIPLGVDLEAIDAEAPSETRVDVLYAGRLLDHKGVDILLRAVFAATLHRPDLTCLIVGEGPERANLERLCADLGLAANVRFSDFLPDDGIFGVMKSAGVFVLPSEREGYGLVVIEANACGLPVVTVRNRDNAARHLIRDGVNGYLADREARDLARVLLLALSSRSTLSPRSTVELERESLDWDGLASQVGRVLLNEVSDGC